MPPEQFTASLAAVCRSYPVSLAYLFGSHARGTADAESDIDVAVPSPEAAAGCLSVDADHATKVGKRTSRNLSFALAPQRAVQPGRSNVALQFRQRSQFSASLCR